MGDIITNLRHSQDTRFLSSGIIQTSFSYYVMYVSLLNLLGIPRVSGFFSKDLILEAFGFSGLSFLIYSLLLLGIFFTYFYTYKLFYFSFSRNKISPFSIISVSKFGHSILLRLFGAFSIVFGNLFLNIIAVTTNFPRIPLFLKLIPLFLNFSVLLLLISVLSMPKLKSSVIDFYFSGIIFLQQFIGCLLSNFYLIGRFNIVKS